MNNSQNQQTMNYQNFNAQTMNQMNQNIMNMNQNTLYWQNFQYTFQNMQPNMNLVNTNFNNMTNILSLIVKLPEEILEIIVGNVTYVR